MKKILLRLVVFFLPGSCLTAQSLPLWPEGKAPLASGEVEASDATLNVFRPKKPNGTAIVICPGGGYGRVVGGEGAPIAKWLNAHGITGLVLHYRLPRGNPLRPLSDVRRALQVARARAGEWGYRPDRVGVMGFSAGGHLAAMATTQFQEGIEGGGDPVLAQSSRPDFAILVYPVITMGPESHAGSRRNLLGADPGEALIRRYSNELQVTARTPPTFLTHASDDRVVTPSNSLLFHEALKAKKIPTEYLKLASGGHGLNGYRGPMWDAWQKRSLEWLEELWASE